MKNYCTQVQQESPWGQIDSSTTFEPGISSVSTPRHGGIKVSEYYADQHLTAAAKAAAIHQDGVYWFEEDCAWCIPAWELLLLRPQFFSYSKKTPEQQAEYLLTTLKHWEVAYCIAQGLITEGEEFFCMGCNGVHSTVKITTDDAGKKHYTCSECKRNLEAR